MTATDATRGMEWAMAVSAFLEQLREDEKSPHTLYGYNHDLKTFETWFTGHYDQPLTLEDLGPAVLREWKGAMSIGKKHAPNSVNRRLGSIRSFLRWAETKGYVPAFRLPSNQAQVTPPPRWLSVKDQRSLVRAVEKSRDKRSIAIVKTLLFCGLRIHELRGMKWDDLVISPRKGEVTILGKGSKLRVVPLNPEVRDALLDYGGELARGNKAAKDLPVWQGQKGAITIRQIARIIEDFAAAAKLEDFSAHVLRHTFCKRLGESGTPIEVIARLAGHSSLETTRRYLEPGRADLQAAVDKLGGGSE